MGSHEGISFNPIGLLTRKIDGWNTNASVDHFVREQQILDPIEPPENPVNSLVEQTTRQTRTTLFLGIAAGLIYPALIAIDRITNGAIQEGLARTSRGENPF